MIFVDERVGWISSREALYRTEDSGQTWRQFDFSSDGSISGISAPQRNEFWAVTWGGTVLSTVDGGLSWRRKKLPTEQLDESYPRAISSDKDGNVWVGSAMSKPILMMSSDHGENWREVEFAEMGGNVRVSSIGFAKNGVGEVVFRRIYDTSQPIGTVIAKTTNFGITWNAEGSEGLPFAPNYVVHTTDSIAYLVGPSKIARTDNGGAHWDLIYSYSGK